MKTYRRCPREYMYRYLHGYTALSRAGSLRFGGAAHIGIETMLTVQWDLSAAMAKATEAMGADADLFERAKLDVILAGYHTRWNAEPLEVLAVEREFLVDLVNPETGEPSERYNLAGKLDAVVADLECNAWIMEHKTASSDISSGSTYWDKLKIDSQVSNYFTGAESLGFEPVGVIYDVLRKPSIRPLLATPEDQRKYAKKTGELYANQRANDETPEEFRERLVEIYATKPEEYFVRGEVVRLDDERIEAAQDIWELSLFIHESERSNRWPRNPDACERYHRLCEFWPVCTKTAEIDDTSRFVIDKPHRELELVA